MQAPETSVEGLLLTRHWRDTPRGVELILWAWSPDGPIRMIFPNQSAVCFIARETSLDYSGAKRQRFERRELELTDLNGTQVDGLYFRQQRDLNRFRETAQRQDLLLYESEIKPTDRFLMERFVKAPLALSGKCIPKPAFREYLNPRIKPGSLSPEFRYLSLDIETDGMDGEILSIAFCNPDTEEILMQGQAEDWPTTLNIRWYKGEKALLTGFIDRLRDIDPDLLLGWNLINFDLDYLERRCSLCLVPFNIGRGGEAAAVLPPQQSGQPSVASIPGRVALDGIDHLRSAFWSFDSFELGHVASRLLGRKKLI